MSHDGSSWMRMDKSTSEWQKGFKKFIETPFGGTFKGLTTPCPCSRCRCMSYRIQYEVERHLLVRGFDESFIQEQGNGEALADDETKMKEIVMKVQQVMGLLSMI